MPAWILEVNAASAIMVVDLPSLREMGIGPKRKTALLHPPENLIEFLFANQESIMLHLHFHPVGVEERERDFVVYVDVKEWTERYRLRPIEDFGKKLRRLTLVPRMDDGVIQFDCHIVSIRHLRRKPSCREMRALADRRNKSFIE